MNCITTKRKWSVFKNGVFFPTFENKHESKYWVHGTRYVHQRASGPKHFLFLKQRDIYDWF